MVNSKYNDIPTISQRLEDLERRMLSQETSPRASATSIDLGQIIIQAGANIVVKNEDGETVQVIGRQTDGTYTSQILPTASAPIPPTPTSPILTAQRGGMTVEWDSKFFNDEPAPADFLQVDVHISETPRFDVSVGNLEFSFTSSSQRASTFVSKPAVMQYVKFVARSQQGAVSYPSGESSVMPVAIVDVDELNDALAPLDGLSDQVDEAMRQVEAATWSANAAEAAAQVAITAANGKNKITFSPDVPTSGDTGVEGDIWYQKSSDNIIGQWEYTGGIWVPKVLDNAVIATLDAGKISTGFLNADRIAANSITSVKIAAEAIIAAKIAADAVTAEKILAGSITTAKLAALAVTADKIAANSITAGKLESILTLSNKIIAGNPTGSRVELGTFGLRKYAADGTSIDVDLSGPEAIFSGRVVGSDIIGSTIRTAQTGARIEIFQGNPTTPTTSFGQIGFYRASDGTEVEPWGKIAVNNRTPALNVPQEIELTAGRQITSDDTNKSSSLFLRQMTDNANNTLSGRIDVYSNDVNITTRSWVSPKLDNGTINLSAGSLNIETRPKADTSVGEVASGDVIHTVYTLTERNAYVRAVAENIRRRQVEQGNASSSGSKTLVVFDISTATYWSCYFYFANASSSISYTYTNIGGSAQYYTRINASATSGVGTTGVRVIDQSFSNDPLIGTDRVVRVVFGAVLSQTTAGAKPSIIGQVMSPSEVTSYARQENVANSTASGEARQVTVEAFIPASNTTGFKVVGSVINRNSTGTVGVAASANTDYMTVSVQGSKSL